MNKNITKSILALLACSAAFCACSREEADLFDKSAADRLNEVSATYSQRMAAKGGEWIMEYFPTNNSDSITSPYAPMSHGYLMLNKFSKDGSVKVAMCNAFSNNKYKEDVSAWEILTDLGPVLSYNTYNQCLHTFSNPEAFSNSLGQGDNGTGVGGDYEFVITHLEEDCDQTMLKGKKRGAYTRLTRMAEGTNFEEYFAEINDFAENHFPEDMPNDLVMIVDGTQYYARNLATGIACIWPVGESWADTKTYHPFLLSKQPDGKFHFRFRDVFEGKNEGEEVQEFAWDADQYRFVDVDNSSNIIRGLDAADLAAHYAHSISLNGWKLSEELSPEAQTLYNNLVDGLTKKSSQNVLQNITVKLFQDVSDPDNMKEYMTLDIYYKQGRTTQRHLIYNYKFTVVDGKFQATYDGPKDKFSTDNITIDGVQDFINLFAGTFNVSAPAEAGFLINKVILTDTNNSGRWFRMNYLPKQQN